MSRKIVPTWNQKEKITTLVDDLGVLPYRESKAALGIGRMKPFQRMSYIEAIQVIDMLESLKKERFNGQGENGTISYSHQPRPSRPRSQGVLEPASERSEA